METKDEKGPLVGAAAVRELTSEPARATSVHVLAEVAAADGGVVRVPPVTADVEHDGDRGPRASGGVSARVPPELMPAHDIARAAAVAGLVSSLGACELADLALLSWIALQLPRARLRAACEAAAATGWVAAHAKENPARCTRLDRAQSALLGTVRAIEPLLGLGVTPRRSRDEIVADEIERKAVRP